MRFNAARRLGRKHRRHTSSIQTVTYGWGRNTNDQLGWQSGYVWTKPTGIELQNAVGFSIAYAQCLALMPDRTVLCWGQNHSSSLPTNVGPQGRYAGKWEYRTGLLAQQELEKSGFSEGEVLAKEQSFTMPALLDSKKRALTANGVSIGQLRLPAGAVVLHKGETWRAVKENVGHEPGVSGGINYWVRESVEVEQFEESPGRWVQFANSKALPFPAPGLANVTAIAGGGGHGCALVEGKVYSWGYQRYGILGVGVDGSWGAKPRPKNPRPKLSPAKPGSGGFEGFATTFKGVVTKGSAVITETKEISKPKEPSTGRIIPTKLKEGDLFVDPNGFGSGLVIPEGTEMVSKPYNEEAHTVTMTKPATGNYSGNITFQLPGLEVGYWPETQKYNPGWPIPALNVTDAVAIATNSNPSAYPMTLALTSGGEVWVWGVNTYGVLGDLGTTSNEKVATQPQKVKEPGGANMKNIIAVATGEVTCLALTSDRKVWVWGKVEEAQAGKKPLEEAKPVQKTSTPILMEGLPTTVGERPVALAATLHTCYALLEDGTVMSWGGNEHGELGHGTVSGKKSPSNKEPWNGTPERIAALSNIRYIAAGREHMSAVTESGALYVWGGNANGAVGDGFRETKGASDKGTPQLILEEKVLSVALGEYNTFAILEGTSAAQVPIQYRLVPEGEVLGEQSASLKLRWRSSVTTGWELVYKPEPSWLVEKLLEEKREELEQTISEGEEPAKLEAEEELALLEEEEAARKALQTTLAISPVEVSSGVWEYHWTPPSRLTPESGFEVSVRNKTHEGEWSKEKTPTILTNYLWGSPLSFAAF